MTAGRGQKFDALSDLNADQACRWMRMLIVFEPDTESTWSERYSMHTRNVARKWQLGIYSILRAPSRTFARTTKRRESMGRERVRERVDSHSRGAWYAEWKRVDVRGLTVEGEGQCNCESTASRRRTGDGGKERGSRLVETEPDNAGSKQW